MGRQLIDLLVAQALDDIGHVPLLAGVTADVVNGLGRTTIQVGAQLIPQIDFCNAGDGGDIGVSADALAAMTGIT
ncbi:hypothetical protein D3C78_1801430 [compost metagenome]